jgi:predicted metal-dependent hydrolase
MIHLKNSGYIPQDAKKLLSEADKLVAGMHAIVRDMRVSSRYLEFDISISKEYLNLLVEKLEMIGPLDNARHLIDEEMEKEEAVEKGRYYFNYERFWECHETLEVVWKKIYDGEKDLVQGIILVAAAFVHYQKNENEICLSILRRAIEKIGNASGKYYKIDIDVLRKNVLEIIHSGTIMTFMI